MKTIVTAAAVAALAGISSAATFTASPTGPMMGIGGAPADRTAEGDLAGTIIGLTDSFGLPSSIGDGFLHEIGQTESVPNASNAQVSSSVTDNGDGTRSLVIEWASTSGALVGSGNTGVNFQLGEGDAPADIVEDPDFVSIADPVDPMNPDRFLGVFELLDSSGGNLFTGDFFIAEEPGGFSGVVFINAGGADLGDFDIGAGRATITYNIPTPGAMGLLGVAGLAASRRRR